MVSLDALSGSDLLREGSLVYHQYAARLAPEVSLDEVREALGDEFRDAGWQMRTYDNAAPGIQRMIERLGSFLSLVGLTALLVGGVGVGNAVRAWLDTRLGVIATLKCLGASRSVVFASYLSQLTVIAGSGSSPVSPSGHSHRWPSAGCWRRCCRSRLRSACTRGCWRSRSRSVSSLR